MAGPNTLKVPAKEDFSDKVGVNKDSGTEMVSIACKLPNGLILQVYRKVRRRIPAPAGAANEVDIYEPYGKQYRVHGCSHPQNMAPHCTIIGGYAITANIPKQHWEAWLAQHRDDDMVRNGLIFANSTTKIAGEAKEKKAIKSNLERLDPNKLPGKIKIDKDNMNADVFNKIQNRDTDYEQGRSSQDEDNEDI